MDAPTWENLVRVTLPSGNQAVYSNSNKIPKQITPEQVRYYGTHIATQFKNDGWQVRAYLKNGRFFRPPTPEEQQLIDSATLLE